MPAGAPPPDGIAPDAPAAPAASDGAAAPEDEEAPLCAAAPVPPIPTPMPAIVVFDGVYGNVVTDRKSLSDFSTTATILS